ncbi:DUF998 domain-containing protein [Amycolatopsis nalaikhensis]|uniref:DUF998 domain-containing protein n=1 Tax=Amycolatopsis nalaikhensis TaxID=715472 RepID=A0ABY8XJE8_9PSEU|nr:DUF998 domain-containing protein [Amycolatopsis sp. 2-2]WIV55741.1 DUF998 domain-containing protein [Amycolatopsis sp. 2-2]
MVTVPARRVSVAVSLTGLAALVLGAALVLLLQVIPPTDEISATRRTISEYGLSDHKWVFDLAVVLVALGSAAGLAVLGRQRRLPVPAAILGTLWTVGLLVIVAFPKPDWATVSRADFGGTLHRIASVVAFVALPLAVMVAARTAFPGSPGRRWLATLLAIASLGWFAVILGAVVVAAVDGGRWWTLIPLGLVERGMALTELVALGVLLAPHGERRPALG